jgi:uncharacterized membrane protein YfcA
VTLFDPVSFALISAGIFAGAVVSGMVGFAFSAVAGVALLHVLPPIEAVPLMMACSLVTQFTSLVALRRSVSWKGCPLLIGGGLIGVVPALYLLRHVDCQTFRIGFGIFLACYAAIMLLRPPTAALSCRPGGLGHAIVGFGGGIIGGLTAMPGALPTMWCDLCGMSKDQQRGLVHPYIVVLQIFALALMLAYNTITKEALVNLTYSLPALAAAVAIGIALFRRDSNTAFRSAVLVVLLFAGVLHVI